jgi:hypothetical protein
VFVFRLLISRHKLIFGVVRFCRAQLQRICYAGAIRRISLKEVLYLQLLNSLRGVFQTRCDIANQALAGRQAS